MTEAEWISTISLPKAMLRHVRAKVSPRKLRLTAGAGCRLVWRTFRTHESDFIKALIKHADGILDEVTFLEIREPILHQINSGELFTHSIDGPVWCAMQVVESLVHGDIPEGTLRTVDWIIEAAVRVTPGNARQSALADIRREICSVIREVLGNPFRPFNPVASWLGGGFVQPDGLTVRLTDATRGLATGIHAEQAFDRLPLLADALEDAGATDLSLLDHLRAGTDHVRGCWALDVVLGKT